jgi:hypothetical protein
VRGGVLAMEFWTREHGEPDLRLRHALDACRSRPATAWLSMRA